MALSPEEMMNLYMPQGPDLMTMGSLMQSNPDIIPMLMASQGIAPPQGPLSEMTQMAGLQNDPNALAGPAPFAPRFDAMNGMTMTPPPAPPMMPSTGMRSATEFPTPQPGDQGKPSPYTKDGIPPREAMTPNTSKEAEGTVPVPRPRPASAPGGGSAAALTDAMKGGANWMSGIKAPTAPEQQRIYSPQVPGARGVPAANIEALVMQMLKGGAMGDPLRLGQALRF